MENGGKEADGNKKKTKSGSVRKQARNDSMKMKKTTVDNGKMYNAKAIERRNIECREKQKNNRKIL